MNKPCPFCGYDPAECGNIIMCCNKYCSMYNTIFNSGEWNYRPTEDKLESEIVRLSGLFTPEDNQPILQATITKKRSDIPQSYNINFFKWKIK